MRLFTLIVSAALVVVGAWMAASGEATGWWVAGFFGLCLVVAAFEPLLATRRAFSGYRLSITGEEIACEHPERRREAIRWDDVSRIWYVTTSDGPRLPDEWILLEGEQGGCSFPTEASGMEGVWGELERRFEGFDFGPLIRGGTDDARHLCWERRPANG